MRSALLLTLCAAACAAPRPAPVAIRPPPLPVPTASVAAARTASAACDPGALVREERHIDSEEPGISVFVLRVAAWGARRGAVVLTHGAGSGGSASWDLRGASLMRALACRGLDTYAFDARGFGGSTRPAALSLPAEGAAPVVRMHEVVLDLGAVVAHAARSSSVAQIDLVGWSWGSDVAGLYAGEHPERVRRLALLSPVFDRRWPTRHLADRSWYPQTREELMRAFPADREERAVWEDFVDSMFRFEPAPVLRLPAGPYRDLYGEDAPLWDPSRVKAPVLLMRGADDKASLEVHFLRLYSALSAAPERTAVTWSGLAHFLLRERRRAQAVRRLGDFLLAQ